jgi:hypothetical protein
MIRAVLASPWLPLLYWTAAFVAIMIWGTHQESLQKRPRNHQTQMVLRSSVSTPAKTHDNSFTPRQYSGKLVMAAGGGPSHFWYPHFSVFQKADSSAQKAVTEGVTNVALSPEVKIAGSPSITMLSIRVDPVQNTMAKTLAIQCRTSVPFSNAHGRTVTIHGVVSQEVVSSTGKILIMAGSKVVGSGQFDLENGRFKSDGLWSIFFDDTELQVQAQLLDRPAGLPGILGQEALNEDEALRRRDGRSIIVPRNAPFVLEVRGEIQLRDLKSHEASNP